MLWAIGAIALGGCTGLIGDPGGDESTSNGGSGGKSQALECVPGSDPDPGPSPLRRLTSAQWANTVRDLFGSDVDPGGDFPKTTIKHGFRSYADSNIVSATGADAIRLAAEHVARQIETNAATKLGCDPATASCAAGFIQSFGERAYRRPLLPEERTLLESAHATALSDGFSPAEAIGIVIEVALQSPQFLYRAEIANPSGAAPGSVVRVDHWEMASRLSYLIWDTMPDAALTSLAAAGKLGTKAEVEAEARRMLDDPRARPTLARFFEDWLELHRLDLAPKDQAVFPEYDAALDQALREELGRTASHVVWELDGRLETLLSAPVAVVDSSLAALYGVSAPSTSGFAPVELDPSRRAGILTSASFSAAHANSETTNPVARGAFVRNQLLCQVLLPPDGLVIEPITPDPNLSKREQFAQHRDDESCAGCHALMDPIGFGFENYDAIGRWRDKEENGMAIDPSGELVDADDATGAFGGPIELVKLLAGSQIVHDCMALQTFRFAAGREENPADGCSVKSATERFRESGGDIKELIVALTQTDAFFHRRIQEVTP